MVAIFVAFIFVSLVLTDLAVEKWRVWRMARAALPARPRADAMAYGFEPLYQIPEGVCLADQHTWVKPDPAGGLAMGVDALIVRAVGVVRRILLPKVGDQVTAGQPLFALEHNGCSITIPSALTGRVMAINNHLVDQPELLSSDPYGSGWVCHLSPTRVEHTPPESALW